MVGFLTKKERRRIVNRFVRPLYPSDGFLAFCRMEIRKGLTLWYWITLPAMYRREMQFRRDFESALQKYQDGGKIIPMNSEAK